MIWFLVHRVRYDRSSSKNMGLYATAWYAKEYTILPSKEWLCKHCKKQAYSPKTSAVKVTKHLLICPAVPPARKDEVWKGNKSLKETAEAIFAASSRQGRPPVRSFVELAEFTHPVQPSTSVSQGQATSSLLWEAQDVAQPPIPEAQ